MTKAQNPLICSKCGGPLTVVHDDGMAIVRKCPVDGLMIHTTKVANQVSIQ